MKKLIEMYKDPKKKAIAQLILFLIFFIFVYIFIKTGSSINDIPIEPRSIKNNNNYSYVYTINDVVINGNNIDEQNSFVYNNVEYKLINNYYIDSVGNYFSLNNINIALFSRQNIINIISNLEYVETTTYKDKTVKTIYEVSYRSFGIDSDSNTVISVYKDINNDIYKCELVLNDYNIILEYNAEKE